MSETIVRLENVSKVFGEAAHKRNVLTDLSHAFQAGDRMAVVGASGSGKSTLLNIIAGLDQVTSGSVVRLGLDDAADDAALARWRNANIGFIFQDHHLLPQYTVLENILLPITAFTTITKADEQRAKDLLASVQLGDRGDEWPQVLSGGERQRIAVLRSLIMKPKLLLADEPTGALDRDNAGQIADLLDQVQEQNNCALLVVTHQMELAQRMQQQFCLRDGALVDLTT